MTTDTIARPVISSLVVRVRFKATGHGIPNSLVSLPSIRQVYRTSLEFRDIRVLKWTPENIIIKFLNCFVTRRVLGRSWPVPSRGWVQDNRYHHFTIIIMPSCSRRTQTRLSSGLKILRRTMLNMHAKSEKTVSWTRRTIFHKTLFVNGHGDSKPLAVRAGGFDCSLATGFHVHHFLHDPRLSTSWPDPQEKRRIPWPPVARSLLYKRFKYSRYLQAVNTIDTDGIAWENSTRNVYCDRGGARVA